MLKRCLALVLLALVLLAPLSLPARAEPSGAPVEVPAIISVSGSGAFLGEGQVQMLKLIEGLINRAGGIGGRPLHFSVKDDQSVPQVAVQLATAEITRHPPLIVGSSLTATCNAMAPLAKNGPVIYCFSPGPHPEPGSYFFASNQTHDELVAAAVQSLHLRGVKRIALLTVSDATGQDGERAALRAASLPSNAGTQIVAVERFNPTDVGVTAQVARIKEANPEAIISWTTGTALGTVLRGVLQGGLEVPVVAGTGNLSYAFMKQYGNILPRDLEIPTGPGLVPDKRLNLDPRVAAAAREFVDAFASIDRLPDTTGGAGWDSCLIAVRTLQKLGPGATAQQLRAAIEGIKGLGGIWGIYDFARVPNRGVDGSQILLARWDAPTGRFVPMSQPGGAPLE